MLLCATSSLICVIESKCTLIELCSDVKRDDAIAKFCRKGREDCPHMSNILHTDYLVLAYLRQEDGEEPEPSWSDQVSDVG